MEISGSIENPVYDLYGNGNELWTTNDEAFYLYTKKSGSWSLSGKLQWCSPGGGDVWAKVAIMIREKGEAPDSKYYSIMLCSGGKEPYGDLIVVQKRTLQGGYSESFDKETPVRHSSLFVPSPGDEIYFRVSRITSENLFYSEFSYDGEKWNFLHWTRIDMDKTVSYGVVLNNHADNELLAHARVTDMVLEPAPPIAFRRFLDHHYALVNPVKVQLTLTNAREQLENVTITEKLPKGWIADAINPEGIQNDGTIIWSRDIEPGTAVLTYDACPQPESSNEVAIFRGEANSLQIVGEMELPPLLTNSGFPPSGQWRFWTTSDGLFNSCCYRVSVGENGSVWSTHSIQGIAKHYPKDTVSRLDGYNVKIVEDAARNTPIYEDRFGQIWSLPLGGSCYLGLQRYEPVRGEWIKWEIEEIKATRIPTGVPDRIHIALLSLTPDRILFLLPDRLMEFNTAIEQVKSVKEVNDTNLGSFRDMCFARDGGVWITGLNGHAKLKSEQGAEGPLSEYTEYLFKREYGFYNLLYPFEDEKGNLWGVISPLGNPRECLMRFNGNSWKMLYSLQHYSNDKRLLRVMGYPNQNESFWIAGLSSTCRIEGNKEELVPKNVIIPEIIWDIAMEPNDVLWLATAQGLARHSPVPWRAPAGIPRTDQVCHSIVEDQKRCLWFACVDTLNCYESGQWKTYSLPRRLFEFDTNSLCVLPDGRIAIRPKTDSLFVFNPETESVEYIQRPASHHIELIAQRGNGEILLDSYGSSIARLESYDGKQFHTILERKTRWETGYSRYMIEAMDGTIWMGGEEDYGLARIQNGQYQLLGPEDNYPGGDAFCILEKDDGKIWIGGRNSILEYHDNKFTVVRSGFGIVQSMIQSRNGDIWVASENGLHWFRNGSWITHTEEDGLPTRMVYEVFEDSQSRIWIGTSQGIRQYDPKTDTDPPVALLDPKNPKEFSSEGEGQFIFAGIDKWKFTESHRLLYSYKIDNENWSPYASSTIASVTGLRPGNHILHYCHPPR